MIPFFITLLNLLDLLDFNREPLLDFFPYFILAFLFGVRFGFEFWKLLTELTLLLYDELFKFDKLLGAFTNVLL